jgi:flap endonuclease-1
MGIKGLTHLLKTEAPGAIESVSLSSFRDKRVAVDISIFLYKSLANVRYNGDYLRNKEGKNVSHIVGIFNKTVQFLSVGVQPIYVFDGKPPEEKWECLQARHKKVNDCKDKMEAKNDISEEERKSLEKGTIRVTKDHVADIKRMFDLMGVSYVHNPVGEAEAYAAELCRIGYVDAVVTEDMDTLAYGCPKVLRNCIDRSIKRRDVLTCFSYAPIIEAFKMTHEQFVDVCILSGCDYCPTIPKIGTVRAFQYITQYGSIEGLIESGKFEVPQGFLDRYKRSRELFQVFQGQIDSNDMSVSSSIYDPVNLHNYLVNECSMGDKKVQTALNKIYR